jgi:hypothetical protein
MKGDFTRDTFNPTKHYSSVLMQQGRVQLDADWNEQARLVLHRLETLARDLIGWGGGPDAKAGGGFDLELRADEKDFMISPGRYYVEGMLVENDAAIFYSSHGPEGGHSGLDREKTYLVYLDAWEDFVGAAEDPGLREIALGGADTAGRARVQWRVRTQEIPANPNCADLINNFPKQVAAWQGETRGRMRARVNPGPLPVDDPCIIPPSNRYRGAENQLYRVEIHRSGPLQKTGVSVGPTFKWSRENGSVVYPVASGGVSSDTITVTNTGRDSNLGVRAGDWVELDRGDGIATQAPRALLRVTRVSGNDVFVIKEKGMDAKGPAVLRRWDQKQLADNRGGVPLFEGTVPVREGVGEVTWIPLENGIEVQFQRKDVDPKNSYRTGDYWLIPARTANSGEIDWPATDGEADFVVPHGVTHRYAPLAAIQFSGGGKVVCQMRKTMGSVVDIQAP